MTWPRASSATAGTSRASATPTIWRCSSAPLRRSRTRTDRPTLIIVDSHIAYGAPNKQDTSAAHGEPLGEEEIRLTKRNYGWPEDAKFLVPDGVHEHFRGGIGTRGQELRDAWWTQVRRVPDASIPSWPTMATACSAASCPRAGNESLPTFPADAKGMATRDASARC